MRERRCMLVSDPGPCLNKRDCSQCRNDAKLAGRARRIFTLSRLTCGWSWIKRPIVQGPVHLKRRRGPLQEGASTSWHPALVRKGK